MTSAIQETWDDSFPGLPPIAHLFREFLADRWVRFHSLPDAKRYPETECDYETILTRHNTLLDELARGRIVTLVTTGFSSERNPGLDPALGGLDVPGRHWLSLPMHLLADGDPEDPIYWHLFASDHAWSRGVLDPLLKMVADNELSNVFLFSAGETWVFHPYDGGADVFLPTTHARDDLKARHAEWLSDQPGGL